jgi:hypothetical protein
MDRDLENMLFLIIGIIMGVVMAVVAFNLDWWLIL